MDIKCETLTKIYEVLDSATGGTTTIKNSRWVDKESFFTYYHACCKALAILEGYDT